MNEKEKWDEIFSDNIKDFEGYSIGKLLEYTKEPDIISFAVGMPSSDTFPVELVREGSQRILRENAGRILQYSPIPGEESFFESIIDYLKMDNIEVEKEQILITNGGQHCLDLVGRLFLNPGDSILLDRPTFGGAIVAFKMERPKFIGVNIKDDGSDINGFRRGIEKGKEETGKLPKFIYVVPDFQNPSGITMSLEKRKELLDLSYRYDIPIIEDSPYRELRYRGETLPSIFSLDQQRDGTNVIGLYTFSKIFSPGIRVGFNIGHPSIIDKMTNIKEANVLNTPKLNQDLCEIFLRETDFSRYYSGMRKYYGNKLDIILKALEKYLGNEDGVSWTKPEGGLFLWVTLPEHIDTRELFFDAIEKKVAFVPGDSCFAERPEKNHLRINFSHPDRGDIEKGIKRLSETIKEHL